MSFRLLDCTLRDGGHVNNSHFGKNTIDGIVRGLEKSCVDYIEIGFLRDGHCSQDFSVYQGIEDTLAKVELNPDDFEYTLMIQQDQFNIEKLEPCNGRLNHIRVSFHDYDRAEGIEYCSKVAAKGYSCSMNPINIMGYSDYEILELVDAANSSGVGVFTIVDTFGSMRESDLFRIFYIVNQNLKPEIDIGIHLHDNMLMAFSLAQSLMNIFPHDRKLIIDASLHGMGRTPGNLCMELITDYLNNKYGFAYNVDTLLDLIDLYILPIKNVHSWGYSPAYALSAQYNLHRTYAEYLLRKQKIMTKEIRQILGAVESSKKSRFDEAYIERLYTEYTSVNIDDNSFIEMFSSVIKGKKILVLSPGKTLVDYSDKIGEFISDFSPLVISANFVSDDIDCDYVFCSNIRRFETIRNTRSAKVIATSNITCEDSAIADYWVSVNRLAEFQGKRWDNCALMLLNMLKICGAKGCNIAGFDGFGKTANFADSAMESIYDFSDANELVRTILSTSFRGFDIGFITPSVYNETMKL